VTPPQGTMVTMSSPPSSPPPSPQQQQPQSQQGNKTRLSVYTIEECPACGQKTKRAFQPGDYITKDGANCSKCGNPTKITLIYAEPVVKSK
jgi:rRNA maturation protein Nop10